MEQLLNEYFEYEVPRLILSEEKLQEETEPDTILTGSFRVSASEERKVRGWLYSSNPRVTFDPGQFSGLSAEIRYQVDTTGLSRGEETEGVFTFCTDIGEYTMPYRFRIRTLKETADTGEITDSAALAELCRQDAQAARAVFAGKSFAAACRANPDEALLYDTLRRSKDGNSGRNLEEFLIGCGRKEPVEISMDQTSVQMNVPPRSVRQSVTVEKAGWGYLEITVSSDNRFLRPEKKLFTTDDFVGDHYELGYIIDKNFLHAGYNYGRLQIRSSYQTVFLDVRVDAGREKDVSRPARVRKLMRRKLLGLYVDLRMKRIDIHAWIERSGNVLSGYRRAGGTDIFADLFQIQLYYADGKKTKGERLLQSLQNDRRRFETQEQYAFYLYLSTFFDQDAAYVDQVERRIEQMFLQNRTSWVMQWILLYLQERYLKNDAARLEAILTQVGHGCSSPIMYVEAVCIYRKNPYLCRKLDLSEQKILLYAAKNKMLTEELIYQISSLALQNVSFSPQVLRILEACWEQVQSDEVLKAICTMLIAGAKKDQKYFVWYSRALSRDLRITGLYEFYMETMDTVGIEKMPQIIRMYFSYDTTLNYHKKAAIYRNISDNRESVPAVYRSSRTGIEHFITEQLGMERIDENLAVLYERFLTKRMLNRSNAHHLVKLLFTFEVTSKNPAMRSVIVASPVRKQEKETPLKNGHARIRIYTEDSRIFLTDDQGKRYTSTSLYLTERYLSSPLLITWCREIVPDDPGIVTYMCSHEQTVTAQTLAHFKQACEMDSLDPQWRRQLRKKVLDYYDTHSMQDDLYEYLRTIHFSEFILADKKILLSLLTREGMFEQAWLLLQSYGSEGVDTSCLVRICSQSILGAEFEKQDTLLAYCWQCFQYGKYDENILTYLLMYFDGSIEDMKRLWNTGRTNDMDTMALEERILRLLFFTRTGSANTEPIFAAYLHRYGKRKICRAYLILKSYEYLVRNLPAGEIVFRCLENGMKDDNEMEDACSLALLRYYSTLSELSETQENYVRRLLAKYCGRGIRFAFYQNFSPQLALLAQADDRVFVEYVTDPKHTVKLNYRLAGGDDKFSVEPMKNSYEGIFVKEFVLFDTEKLECYMQEYDGEIPVKTSDRIVLSVDHGSEKSESRYRQLCHMASRAALGEDISGDLENFYQTDYLTKEIFTLI